jgi:hypothetical protein
MKHPWETYHSFIRWIADHVIILVACIYLFQAFYPYEPMRVLGDQRVIGADRAVPGGVIWLQTHYNKYLPLQAEITKSLKCGLGRSIFISKEAGNNATGLDLTTTSPVMIPILTPVEWHRIKVDMGGQAVCTVSTTWEYEVGLSRKIPVVKESPKFQVQP